MSAINHGQDLPTTRQRAIRNYPTSNPTLETRAVQPAQAGSQAPCPPWTPYQRTLTSQTCAEDLEAMLGHFVSVVCSTIVCSTIVFARNVTIIASVIAVIAAIVVKTFVVSRRHRAAEEPWLGSRGCTACVALLQGLDGLTRPTRIQSPYSDTEHHNSRQRQAR